MLIAVFSLTVLGTVLGLGLGIASRVFHVEGDPRVSAVEALLPGTNCGQCGFPGCAGAAAAMAGGNAALNCCPSGGKSLAEAVAACLGVAFDSTGMADAGPQLAVVAEEICIGCCRCIKVCPTDAVLGAPKQIHAILRDACTGCGSCIERCPTEALRLTPVVATLPTWVWPKPTVPVVVSGPASGPALIAGV